MNVLVTLAVLVGSQDPVPDPNDVKAGWLGFGVFIALVLAVALLGWSLVRHLRKVNENAEKGVFDPSDAPRRRTTLPGEQPQA